MITDETVQKTVDRNTMETADELSARAEFADVLRERVTTYGFLGRLFLKEVDEELYAMLCTMRWPAHSGNELVDEGNRLMVGYLNHAGEGVLTELAVDYVNAFIGNGNDAYSAAYPFESVYTSPKRLLMQSARDDVLVLYRAAGLDKQDTWKEGEDHIAAELEFMQILGERAADALERGDEEGCREALVCQRAFLADHLYAWYPMMARDLERFPQTDFYRGLGKLAQGYLASDLDFLDDVLGAEEDE